MIEGDVDMLTKGIIMFVCGAIGLIATIIWILIDLVSKEKRESKIVDKAIMNTSKQPIKQAYNSVEFVQITESLSTNAPNDYTMEMNDFNDNDKTEGLNMTNPTQFTDDKYESTEKLQTHKNDMTEELSKTEALDRMNSNREETKVLSCLDQT